eukprot:5057162-Amphidinium_carterae.2
MLLSEATIPQNGVLQRRGSRCDQAVGRCVHAMIGLGLPAQPVAGRYVPRKARAIGQTACDLCPPGWYRDPNKLELEIQARAQGTLTQHTRHTSETRNLTESSVFGFTHCCYGSLEGQTRGPGNP